MDTHRIKKFATEARTNLKTGIAAKIQSLGFDADGHIEDRYRPEKIQGATIFNGQMYSEGFYNQWQSLYNRIQSIGLKEVYEEAAYTWFNRLVAIRILQKNGIGSPVLEFVDAARTPQIVDDARMGRFPQMPAVELQALRELILDDTKVTEQFAMLITAYCHNNPIISKCFGSIADYTELLIPNNILADNGFIDTLNHTEFISDDDFKSPELIGWLYQFYISERKDEVFDSFKKGKKAESAEEIAAATQIFTPNWIVKYMVQNTVGRIYLDNNPWEDEIKKDWKYLVEPSSPTPEDCKLKYNDLSELKVGDLACGSGHILNECFDLLFQLYINEGFSRSQAVESIFQNNLVGIDLDTRAKQLATFALLLKACQKAEVFADAHCMPRVLNMPIPYNEREDGPLAGYLHHFFQGTESHKMIEELEDCFDLMQNADSLGSIMKFHISDSTRLLLKQTVEYWEGQANVPELISKHMPSFLLILTLTEKYSALVMNPPYMGSGNMNTCLNKYVRDNYKDGKADLFSAFMVLAIQKLNHCGKYGMINMHSWMFLSSFEALRHTIIEEQKIDSLLHLGPRTFDELSGEVVQNAAFVITNTSRKNSCSNATEQLQHRDVAKIGTYFRLVDGKNCSDKECMYLEALNAHTEKVYYVGIEQHNFNNIPGRVFGYWVSHNVISMFKNEEKIKTYGDALQGTITGDNERFLRLWHEISIKKSSLLKSQKSKWYSHSKGGEFRRWYGNRTYVMNWENDGYEIKNFVDEKGKLRSRPQNISSFFKDGISWSDLCTGLFGARYVPSGSTFDASGPTIPFQNIGHLNYILGYINSKTFQVLLRITCPGLHYNNGIISSLPITINDEEQISDIVNTNVAISKEDWDAHETSWDFARNELLSIDNETYMDNIDFMIEQHYKKTGEHICIDPAAPNPESIEWCYEQYCQKWTRLFEHLHDNEEELNRQFIEIYGLQDELTPEVPKRDITILQQGEISVVEEPGDTTGSKASIQFNADVVMKQLISYAVGVWMGRYRLDVPGLHIAHPSPSAEELASYEYHGNDVSIDVDGIIPILSKDSSFDDNLVNRVTDFIRIAFGNDELTQNLNFIEQCLGTTIENYLLKDFWKDHKKMYQNRPIYWLFSSKKGAFKCITYMHRMDAYTAATVRNKYLLKHIDSLRDQITSMEGNAAYLTTQQTRQLTKMRKDLEECLEYDERLQVYAEKPNAFDLDDGVVVNYAKFGDVLAKLK